MSVRVSRVRAVVAMGRRPTVVARVAGISRQAIYRPITRRPAAAGPGRVRPDDALAYASRILQDQLSIFINFEETPETAEAAEAAASGEGDVAGGAQP